MNEQEFRKTKKKLLLLNVIVDALILFGGIIGNRFLNILPITILSAFCGVLAIVIIFWMYKISHQDGYREVAKEMNDDEDVTLKEVVDEAGWVITIVTLLFALSLIILGIYLFFKFAHSWIKAIYYFIALMLVIDLKNYRNYKI